MIMTMIEEFIKALITEFVSFLIWIWIPALASGRGFVGSLKDQAKPGRIPGHLNNAGKIVDSGFVGDGQSADQTRQDLDV